MQTLLLPRYAPKDTVRVWLGVRQVTVAPALKWFLDGQQNNPIAIRPLQSVRSPALLSGDPPRVFSGIYEFRGLQPGRAYRVGVKADGQDAPELIVRTLPEQLPVGGEQWLNILLVSCFHYQTSPKDILASVMRDIQKECSPSLTLLLGDQVYLDLPTIKDFPKYSAQLAARFEVDYARNWFDEGGYRSVLEVAPSISMSDDHEYWNNFPHASPIIQNSWTAKGRSEWKAAALALYEGFQTPWPRPTGQEVVVDVPPLSIFAADTRADRQEDQTSVMNSQVMQRLGQWVSRINQSQSVGIFVAGQSIFDEPAGKVNGAVGDRTLANYDDFKSLIDHLASATTPLLCITGDVHWGRVLQMRDSWQMNRLAMYEIITSPASLVASVGIDQVKTIGEWWRRLRGKEPNPWPHHSGPSMDVAWRGATASRFPCQVRHGQTGNQVAVLSLHQFGGGVEARIGYYPLHREPKHRQPHWTKPFDLRSGIPQEL